MVKKNFTPLCVCWSFIPHNAFFISITLSLSCLFNFHTHRCDVTTDAGLPVSTQPRGPNFTVLAVLLQRRFCYSNPGQCGSHKDWALYSQKHMVYQNTYHIPNVQIIFHLFDWTNTLLIPLGTNIDALF